MTPAHHHLGRIFLLAGILAGATPAAARGSESVDYDMSSRPAYQPVSGVSGNLNSIGSDTLNNLMTLWAEAFQAYYPNVNIQIEGKGSSTAPPSLIQSTAQLGPMSREMKRSEQEKFEARFGYTPTRIPVGLDALVIYAHKDSPIDALSLRQVDGIFSITRYRGGPAIRTWGELGLDGVAAPRGISLFGRNSASGTHGFFKEFVLFKGDFLATVQEQPGSSAVILGVANDFFSLGYSGIGYKASGVKVLKLNQAGGPFLDPSYANVITGEYPLSRVLWIYVNRPPDEPTDPLIHEFIRLVLSREGQEIVLRDGYYPVPPAVARQTLALLAVEE